MNILTNSIVSITLCLLTMGAYHFQFARDTPQIITVDVNQLIEEKIRTLTSSGQNYYHNKQAIERFGKSIERHIQQLSQQGKVIVLPAQAVLTGGSDHTEQVRRRLREQ